MAWNWPRVYLRLILLWRVRRSKYFALVQACKSEEDRRLPTPASAPVATSHGSRRILFVIHWFELGGAEAFALYTMKTAKELGHSCYCISTVPSPNTERDAFSVYCGETVTYADTDQEASFEAFVSNYIRINAIDALHIHHSALMYDALPAISHACPNLLIIDSTHIVEYRNGGFPQLSATYSDYIDVHNVISRNLLCVQRALYQREFGHQCPFEKFHWTYLSGLTPDGAVKPRHSSRSRKVVTFYGRLVLQKQPYIFVAAMEHLFTRYPDLEVEAQIYGDGDLREGLEQRIARSKFKARLRYLGRCDDAAAVFGDSDILLLTSLNEGLSLTTYEAISFGRLVVSSDVGAQSEVLSTECLVPLSPQFVAQAADRVAAFLMDADRYDRARRQNRQNLARLRQREVCPSAIGELYRGGL